jgi:hypothetical protein
MIAQGTAIVAPSLQRLLTAIAATGRLMNLVPPRERRSDGSARGVKQKRTIDFAKTNAISEVEAHLPQNCPRKCEGQ